MTDDQKRSRRKMIAAAVVRRRKSDAMRVMWEQRRREMREFLDEGDDAGSPDVDLAELPDVLG